MNSFLKIFRFIQLYGLTRTWYKVAGRLRTRLGFLRPIRIPAFSNVGVIGCGQFAFATIGHFIARGYTTPFSDCFDIDKSNLDSLANFYRIDCPSDTASRLISNEKVKYVYIASNHASHALYAINALDAGKVVYIEKPIAVSMSQLSSLQSAVERSGGSAYCGYNRPFSPAIQTLCKYIRGQVQSRKGTSYSPISLNCFISGHLITKDHWYRLPTEGTRICGNVGHWLDLAVHLLEWDILADLWNISLAFSDNNARDDNFSISMTSSMGDLVVIVLTSRSEPFEGINETINFQKGDIVAKIDDFREMSLWQNSFIRKYRYWPKNVGHSNALLQPFKSTDSRDWSQVVRSSLLMLHIAEMVKSGLTYDQFSFETAYSSLKESR